MSTESAASSMSSINEMALSLAWLRNLCAVEVSKFSFALFCTSALNAESSTSISLSHPDVRSFPFERRSL